MDPRICAQVQQNIDSSQRRRIPFQIPVSTEIVEDDQDKLIGDDDGLITLQVSQCLWAYKGCEEDKEFRQKGTVVQKHYHDIINYRHRMLGGDIVGRRTDPKQSTHTSACGQREIRKEVTSKRFRFPAIIKTVASASEIETFKHTSRHTGKYSDALMNKITDHNIVALWEWHTANLRGKPNAIESLSRDRLVTLNNIFNRPLQRNTQPAQLNRILNLNALQTLYRNSPIQQTEGITHNKDTQYGNMLLCTPEAFVYDQSRLADSAEPMVLRFAADPTQLSAAENEMTETRFIMMCCAAQAAHLVRVKKPKTNPTKAKQKAKTSCERAEDVGELHEVKVIEKDDQWELMCCRVIADILQVIETKFEEGTPQLLRNKEYKRTTLCQAAYKTQLMTVTEWKAMKPNRKPAWWPLARGELPRSGLYVTMVNDEHAGCTPAKCSILVGQGRLIQDRLSTETSSIHTNELTRDTVPMQKDIGRVTDPAEEAGTSRRSSVDCEEANTCANANATQWSFPIVTEAMLAQFNNIRNLANTSSVHDNASKYERCNEIMKQIKLYLTQSNKVDEYIEMQQMILAKLMNEEINNQLKNKPGGRNKRTPALHEGHHNAKRTTKKPKPNQAM